MASRAYDRVVELLSDLFDAYKAIRSEAEWFMDCHGRRKALITRIEKAKIWRP